MKQKRIIKILVSVSITVFFFVNLLSITAFASTTPKNGDMNGDGTINLQDAVILFRYISGWNEEIYEPCAHLETIAVTASVKGSCTTDGISEGVHCTACGTVLLTPQTVRATGHAEAVKPAVPPTCTQTGLTEGKYCSVCNEVLAEQTVIPATGHTWGKWTLESQPTPNKSGQRHIPCSSCGIKLKEETIFYNSFSDHVYLDMKNQGNCDELYGKVNVCVILINDPSSSWNTDAQNVLKASLSKQESELENTAAYYGIELDISFSYTVVNIQTEVNTAQYTDDWQNEALAAMGLKGVSQAQLLLDKQGGDSNPIVFAINKSGRAYATTTNGTSSETITMFSTDLTAFSHELCHLYGAEDFYYPASVENLANYYIPESIMCRGDKIDSLTAYLIGWDDYLTSNAYNFLYETKDLTNEYLESEKDKETLTSYVVNHQLSYGIYTGYLERGVPTGRGKLIFSNGDIYEGEFQNGTRGGKGKYTWTSGNVYEGDWVDGERTGQGTLTWANGYVYSGDWINGERTGYGRFDEPSGAYYEGEWYQGHRHGQGKYVNVLGQVFEGTWEMDEFLG